jgi:hypothetical protein
VNETLRERATFDGLFDGTVNVGSSQNCGYKRPLGLRVEGASQIEMHGDIGAFPILCKEG